MCTSKKKRVQRIIYDDKLQIYIHLSQYPEILRTCPISL